MFCMHKYKLTKNVIILYSGLLLVIGENVLVTCNINFAGTAESTPSYIFFIEPDGKFTITKKEKANVSNHL